MTPTPPPARTSESGFAAFVGAAIVLAVAVAAGSVAARSVGASGGPTPTFVAAGPGAPAAAAPVALAPVAPEVAAAIKGNLAARLPGLPAVDEVSATPVPGLYEIRIGTDVLYTDARGDHVIQGQIIDTRTRLNLTEARIEKLTAIDFASLPLEDAVVIVQGAGTRKMVVFGDPNCGFCKRFERDIAGIDDVTIYTFLYPILGPDSHVKSRDVWCAKDRGQAWRAWMVDGVVPPKAGEPCDIGAIERTVALGKRYRVQGTPALVFEDGTRRPGALPRVQVEQLLAAAAGKKS